MSKMTGFVVEGHIYHPLIPVLKTVVVTNNITEAAVFKSLPRD